MERTSDDLRPCPFCGGEAVIERGEISSGSTITFGDLAVCDACGAAAESSEKWNTRPIEDELRARLKDYFKDYEIYPVSGVDCYPGGIAMTRKKNHVP